MHSSSTRRRVGFGALFSLATALALAACSSGGNVKESSSAGGLDAMEPVTFTVSEPLPPNSVANIANNEFMDYVTKKTNGKVSFEVYDTSTLHPMEQALSAMESGLSDITLYIPGLLASEAPAGAWATGLGGFTTTSPLDMLAGSVAAMSVYREGAMAAELAAHNAVYLGGFSSESYSLLCTSPMETLADAKGVLGRSTGGVYDDEMEAIGMVPNLIDANEVYEGLQRGTVDCQVGPVSTFEKEGLAEVAKYYTPLPFSPNTGAGYIMNKDKYDGLPDEVKRIFQEAAPLLGRVNRETIKSFHAWYTTAPEKYDVTFVTPAEDLSSTLADYRGSQAATLAERAPDSVTDSGAVVDQFQAVYADWVKILTDEFNVPKTDGSQDSALAAYDFVANEFDWDRYRVRWYEYLRDLE
ncbi:TRAP transporter substrate-binding protein DctP [Nocardioides sp. NPDC051685]|uniref:TRAP transporter substrate-binding protein DctP n=1 Tax=Nocardioides sp. NPDC051685 TaxID=3364334 RepID=UPI0037AAC02F